MNKPVNKILSLILCFFFFTMQVYAKPINPSICNFATALTLKHGRAHESALKESDLNNHTDNQSYIVLGSFIGTPLEIIAQKQQHYHNQDYPAYSFSLLHDINEFTREVIFNFNRSNADIIINEQKILKTLEPYKKWLIKRGTEIKNGTSFMSSSNATPMLNGMGGSHTSYCPLSSENLLPFLIANIPPSKYRKILDAGSGWGACSKQLALLGYKVYSIDKDKRHIEFQKRDFCALPPPHSFIFNYWKIYKPELIENQMLFQQHCEKSRKNITYITGDFSKTRDFKEIPNKFDIIISAYSMQFLKSREVKTETLKEFSKLVNIGGFFYISASSRHKHFDFDLSDYIISTNNFNGFKIITASTRPKNNNPKERTSELNSLLMMKRGIKNE
jgi:2-polyprenyl-3-methyl-5-hydroxy-6-metoxy-1,4-benzoquinol methylase